MDVGVSSMQLDEPYPRANANAVVSSRTTSSATGCARAPPRKSPPPTCSVCCRGRQFAGRLHVLTWQFVRAHCSFPFCISLNFFGSTDRFGSIVEPLAECLDLLDRVRRVEMINRNVCGREEDRFGVGQTVESVLAVS